MVSFTCENCGDKFKEDIAQHVDECKGPFPLTCIHCKAEFYDDQYKLHTSCASEVPEVHTNLSSSASGKPAKNPCNEVQTEFDYLSVINRLSRNSSLTPQQSSLVASLVNFNNTPLKQPAFGKFVLSRWKGSDVSESVVDEVFVLIHEEIMKGPVNWPRTPDSQEPVWFTAMQATCKGHRILPLHKKIADSVFVYQKGHPIPLSLPNRQSLQNLVNVVCKNSTIEPRVVNEMYDAMITKMADAKAPSKAHDTEETTVSIKKKKKIKHRIDAADIPALEVANKKSENNECKRQEDALEEKGALRKKHRQR